MQPSSNVSTIYIVFSGRGMCYVWPVLWTENRKSLFFRFYPTDNRYFVLSGFVAKNQPQPVLSPLHLDVSRFFRFRFATKKTTETDRLFGEFFGEKPKNRPSHVWCSVHNSTAVNDTALERVFAGWYPYDTALAKTCHNGKKRSINRWARWSRSWSIYHLSLNCGEVSGDTHPSPPARPSAPPR